jgi:hypothetical protein
MRSVRVVLALLALASSGCGRALLPDVAARVAWTMRRAASGSRTESADLRAEITAEWRGAPLRPHAPSPPGPALAARDAPACVSPSLCLWERTARAEALARHDMEARR